MKKRKKLKKFLRKLNPILFPVIFIISTFIIFFIILKLWIPLIFENQIILLRISVSNFVNKYFIIIVTLFVFCLIQTISYMFNKIFKKNKNGNSKKTYRKIISVVVISFTLICELIFIKERPHTKATGLPDLEKIEYYIIECSNREMTYNRLKELEGMELYYIRNGIYAYCGMKFESGFYDGFEWYNGKIEEKDFEWDMLNHYQQLNIKTILKIEKELMN